MELCAHTLETYIRGDWKPTSNEEINQTQFIRKAGPVETRIKPELHVFMEISNGVSYIHMTKFIHRDLKPSKYYFEGKELPSQSFILSKTHGKLPILASQLRLLPTGSLQHENLKGHQVTVLPNF